MTNLQKARILIFDKTEKNIDEIECQFNPEDYTYSKQNTWKEGSTKGKEVPKFDFSGGRPATLKLKLFFDTTETGEDVRKKYTDKIWGLMRVKEINNDSGTGEPYKCRFMWGNKLFFTAVITSLTQKFTYFRDDGRPLRTTLDVTFQQIKDDSKYIPQNPTSRSEPRKTRKVSLGDRIDMIAYEEYGDVNRWYDIALANELDDPLNLNPGQILKIPIFS